jgi:hypothetical protein
VLPVKLPAADSEQLCSSLGLSPAPKVVLKVLRKPDVMTEEEQELFQEASSIALWEEHALLRKPQLQKCKYI